MKKEKDTTNKNIKKAKPQESGNQNSASSNIDLGNLKKQYALSPEENNSAIQSILVKASDSENRDFNGDEFVQFLVGVAQVARKVEPRQDDEMLISISKCIMARSQQSKNYQEAMVFCRQYGNALAINKEGKNVYIFDEKFLKKLLGEYIRNNEQATILNLYRERIVTNGDFKLLEQLQAYLTAKTDGQVNAEAIEGFISDYDQKYSKLFETSKMIGHLRTCKINSKIVKWVNLNKKRMNVNDTRDRAYSENKGKIANRIFMALVAVFASVMFAVLCVFSLASNISVTSTRQEIDFGSEIDISAMTYNGDIVFYKSPIIDLGLVEIVQETDSKLLKVSGYDSSQVGNQDVTVSYGWARATLRCNVNQLQLATPVVIKQESIISWNNISNATSYSIYVNGEKSASTEETSYDLLQFVESSFAVQVVAETDINGYYASEKSESISVSQKSLGSIYLDGNSIVWSAIDGVESYDVVVNNTLYTTTGTSISYDWKVGENTVTVSGNQTSSGDVMVETSITVEKLAAPALSISDENLIVSESGYSYKYYCDGVEFNGVLADLSVGTHYITAVRVATASNQVDSDASTALMVEKLPVPEVVLVDGKVSYKDSKGITLLYCDGVLIDETLEGIVSGTHVLYAVNTPSESYQISSQSDFVSVSKLSAPVLTIKNGDLIASNVLAGFKYSFDGGAQFDNIYDLNAGEYQVYAVNEAVEDWEISSDQSNSLEIVIPNMEFELSETSSNQLLIALEAENLDDYSLTVEFIYYGTVKSTVTISSVTTQDVKVSMFRSDVSDYNEIRVTLIYSSSMLQTEAVNSYYV